MNDILKQVLGNLRKTWKLIFLCLLITLVSYGILFYHTTQLSWGNEDFVYKVESKIFDWKRTTLGESQKETKVGILAIDEKSLSQFGRWPFSRKYYAQAFRNLKKLGVRWISFDVIWAEPERTFLEDTKNIYENLSAENHLEQVKVMRKMASTSPSDEKFSSAIREFSNIILGYFYFGSEQEAKHNQGTFNGLDALLASGIETYLLPEGKVMTDYPLRKAYGFVGNIPIYNQAADHFAFFSNDADEDAINRWVTLVAEIQGNLMPSLSLKSAAEYLERDIIVFFDDFGIESIGLVSREDDDDILEVPVDPHGAGRLLVNHRGPARAFQHFSLADAYNDSFTPEERAALKGKILLLGATATGINDMRPNPFDPAIDGVENHAAAIDNIITGDFYKRPHDTYDMELLIVLGIGLLFSPLLIWGKASLSGVALLAFLGGYYYVDQTFWFGDGTWAYMAVPCGQILTMFISANLIRYIGEEKDKKFLKEAFGSYISPELIDEMYGTGEPPKLGGNVGPLTAYFTDIQSFSSFSEQLSAPQLVELLNEYLTVMTDILLEEKGTLDKYEGDAIIAFFGAPMSLPDHAIKACRVAVKMQEALLELRKKWVSEGDKWPQIVKEMRMRIGINSGEIVTGNMGSRDRMNYTMMGDSVNLAARLEEAAKQYGIFTQVSCFTKDITNDQFEMRELDTIRVVGKTEPVTTYDLLGIKGETSADLLQLKDTFHKGLKLYKDMQWDAAIETFEESLKLEYKRYPKLKGKKTNPSLVYIGRCEEYKKNQPADDWDRVYTLTAK